jgi:PAS domain-containing protein
MSEHTGNQVNAQNAAASRTLIAFLVVIGFLLVVSVQRGVGARQALVESEERYRTLVETSPDAIVAVDNQRKITMCNQQAASLHGYGAPACTLRRLDGSVLPGEVTTAQLHDSQRKPIGSMVIIRDLSERKQAQEARAKLEEHLIQQPAHVHQWLQQSDPAASGFRR